MKFSNEGKSFCSFQFVHVLKNSVCLEKQNVPVPDALKVVIYVFCFFALSYRQHPMTAYPANLTDKTKFIFQSFLRLFLFRLLICHGQFSSVCVFRWRQSTAKRVYCTEQLCLHQERKRPKLYSIATLCIQLHVLKHTAAAHRDNMSVRVVSQLPCVIKQL